MLMLSAICLFVLFSVGVLPVLFFYALLGLISVIAFGYVSFYAVNYLFIVGNSDKNINKKEVESFICFCLLTIAGAYWLGFGWWSILSPVLSLIALTVILAILFSILKAIRHITIFLKHQ